MSLSLYQRNAVAFFKTQLGNSVKQVEAFAGQISPGEVRANAVFPPAVLVYVAGGTIERMSGGFMMIKTTTTAYCLTKFFDKEVKANQDAMTLAERVAELAEGEHFGLDCRATPAVVTAVGNGHQLGLSALGFSLWLTTWEQTIIFGHKDWFAFEEQHGLEPLPLEVWMDGSDQEQLTDAGGNVL
jgi:hypothetical protein